MVKVIYVVDIDANVSNVAVSVVLFSPPLLLPRRRLRRLSLENTSGQNKRNKSVAKALFSKKNFAATFYDCAAPFVGRSGRD